MKPDDVIAVREGHGANCSSVGSVIDLLFLTSAAGAALLAAVVAAMKDGPVELVGEEDAPPDPRSEPEEPQ